MTAAEEQRYAELSARYGNPDPIGSGNSVEPMGKMERLFRQTVNIPGKAVQFWKPLIDKGIGLVADYDDPVQINMEPLPVPQAQDDGDEVIDGGAQIIADLPSYMGSGGVARSGARLLGLGAKATTAAGIAGDVVGGYASGVRHDNREGLTQAGEFGLFGGLAAAADHYIPGGRVLRPLLKAAGNVGIAAGGQKLRGNDLSSKQAIASMIIGGALPIAGEVLKGDLRGLFRRKATPAADVAPAAPAASGPVEGRGYRDISSTPREDGWHQVEVIDDAGNRHSVRRETPAVLSAAPAAPESRLLGEDNIMPPEGGWRSESPKIEPLVRKVEPTQAESLVYQYADQHTSPAGVVDWNKVRNSLENVATRTGNNPELQGIWSEAFRIVDERAPKSIFNPAAAAPLRSMRSNSPGASPASEMLPPNPIAESNIPRASSGLSEAAPKAPTAAWPNPHLPIDHPQNVMARQPAVELPPLAAKPMKGRVPKNAKEAGAVNTAALHNLGGAAAGAVIGSLTDDENRVRNALIGAALGYGGGKALMAARSGKVRDILRQGIKGGQDESMAASREQARGLPVNNQTEALQGLMRNSKDIQKLNPGQKAAVDDYMLSDDSASARALFRGSTVPPAVSDSLIAVRDGKVANQKLTAYGESNPDRIELLEGTPEWQTRQYRAHNDPNWTPPESSNPLIDDLARDWNPGKVMTPTEHAAARATVERWLADINDYRGGNATNRISQNLFKSRKDLTPLTRKVLGEYADPVEREIHSLARVTRSAQAGKLFGDLMRLNDSKGNRFSFTPKDWEAEHAAALAAGDSNKVKLLEQYPLAPETASLGGLAGRRVQKQVLDVVAADKFWNEGTVANFTRAMGRLNTPIKAGFTVLNPATHARNAFQVFPQALTLGLTPRSLIKYARKVSKDPELARWAREDGITSAGAGNDFQGGAAATIENMFSQPKGAYQKGKALLSKGFDKAKQLYSIPDDFLRKAGYGKYIEEAQSKGLRGMEARRYAVTEVNRYTHNYSNTSPFVQMLRNVPGINPFLTYTAEMIRIMKNLAQDVVTNRNGKAVASGLALTSLLGMGKALKELGKRAFTSDKDRQEWEEAEPLLPSYRQVKSNVPLTVGGKLHQFDVTPWLPADDIAQFAGNILKGNFDPAIKYNPVAGLQKSQLLNALTEISTGRDLITGQERTGSDKIVLPLQHNLLPPLFPVIPGAPFEGNSQYEKLRRAFTKNEEGGRGIEDASGQKQSPVSGLLGLVGLSANQVDSGKLRQRAVADLDRELAAPKRKLQAILRSNRTAEAKREAQEEFSRVQHQVAERKQLLRRKAR